MAITVLSPLGIPGPPHTFAPKGTAGVITGVVSRVVETDLARTITPTKLRAVSRATETDTARTISTQKVLSVVQASETDLAQTIGAKKTLAVTRATETDAAQTFLHIKIKAVSRLQETDTARTIATAGTAIVYDYYGESFLYTAANWSNATFKFEVFMRAAVGTAYARLVNAATEQQISGELTTTSTSFELVRSSAVTMADGQQYRAQLGKTAGLGGQAEALGAHIVAYGV